MRKSVNKINLFSFILSNKAVLALITIFMIFYAAFENAIPYSMSFIIDNGLKEKNITVINTIFLILIVFGVIVTFSQSFRDYLYLNFCSRFLKNVRWKTFAYLQELSMCFYSKTAPGDVIARFTTDLAVIEQSLTSAPAQFIIPIFSAIITVILLFVINIPLACISLLIFPAFFIGPYFLTPYASRAGHIRKKSEAVTISDVQTNISSQSVVKSLNLQKISIEFFESGITVISVTHRLSTVVDMDKIFVMDQGKIIEQGRHDILLKQNGIYKQMWDKQS
jgi:ABC-type multidrug transport system fused ATPase/permease subunit